MQYDNVRMGQILRKLRGKRSVQIVADAVGISPSAVRMYEAGERIPRDSVKMALAEYYQISVASIFFSDEYTNRVSEE